MVWISQPDETQGKDAATSISAKATRQAAQVIDVQLRSLRAD